MYSKSLLWIVIIAIVGVAAWYWWNQTQNPATVDLTPTTQSAEVSTEGQQSPPTEAQTSGNIGDSGMSANSDLGADLSAMDAQLQSASADASAAGSFNDTPVQQTE